MTKRITGLIILLIGLLSSSCTTIDSDLPTTQLVSTIKEKYGIPAIAVAIVTSDSLVYSTITGVRSLRLDSLAKIENTFHVGSNTKALTSFLCSILVEKELLTWDTKVFDIFPEFEKTSDPVYKNVTLKHLLSHRGGIKSFTNFGDFDTIQKFEGDDVAKRVRFTAWLLKQPSENVGRYDYSNGGYAMACSMIERVTGQPWQDLMIKNVFEPLELTGGFGWPADQGLNQIYGHYYKPEEPTKLIPHTKDFDYTLNPLICAAGDVTMSALDFGKFIQLNLKGLKGTNTLVTAKTIEFLLNGEKEYALGWQNVTVDNDPVNEHFGTAGTFYSYAAILRNRDIGFVIMTNSANDDTKTGVRELKDILLKRLTSASRQ